VATPNSNKILGVKEHNIFILAAVNLAPHREGFGTFHCTATFDSSRLEQHKILLPTGQEIRYAGCQEVVNISATIRRTRTEFSKSISTDLDVEK
jgi:hypothetical protein